MAWPGIKNRRFKGEFARLELALIEKFEKDRTANLHTSIVEIDGFVSRMGANFLLRPSLGVSYGAYCEVEDLRILPTDFQFGTVKAYRVLAGKTRYASPWKYRVTDFRPISLPKEYLKPDASISQAEGLLWEGYDDASREMRRAILLSMTSSPWDQYRLGGLTADLLPTQSDTHRLDTLLADMKRSVPSELTSEELIQVPVPGVGNFDIAPFPWSMKNLSPNHGEWKDDKSLVERRPSKRSFQEITIGLSAKSMAPDSLEKVWVQRADFPILADDTLTRYSRPRRSSLELAKFMITVHSSFPFTDQYVDENLMSLVLSGLVKLSRDYDERGYSGIVDFNATSGSPSSILAIAKAFARIAGSPKVTADHVRNAEEVWVDAREELFDAWTERNYDYDPEHLSTEMKLREIGKAAQKIHRYLVDHPHSLRAEVRESFPRVQESVFNRDWDALVRWNLIYRASNIDDRWGAV